MKTMTILEYLKEQGIPTQTNGILAKSKESNALGLRFGEGALVHEGGTARFIWLTRTSCERNNWKKGSDVFNELPNMQMVEVALTNGDSAWKIGLVGDYDAERYAQRSILDLFSKEDQAAFAELALAAETKI